MPDRISQPSPETHPFPKAPVIESDVPYDESSEKAAEPPEKKILDAAAEETPAVSASASSPQPTVRAKAIPQKDEVAIHVEKILEEDLGELYAGLPPDAKPIFKKKGEEAAVQISDMVRSFKLKVAQIIRLIREWLMTIPRANKFYLEQEAKIKTDNVVEYAEARREDLAKNP